ncbi:MAG: AMP-binding protein [Pseudomonadota bacterium]
MGTKILARLPFKPDVFGPISGNAELSRPASPNQSRYVLAELSGAGSYMISVGHMVHGRFEEARFRAACQALLDRHDALRTRFQIRSRKIEALISTHGVVNCHVTQLENSSFDTFRAWAVPLVFENVDPNLPGSLIRFMAADYGDAWRFTIAGHHAITDGFSRGVMNRELLKLYEGESLSPAPSYYDVKQDVWPERHASITEFIDQLPVSQRVFSDGDDPRTAAPTGTFIAQSFPDLSKAVKRLAKTSDATRFNVLAAIYALSLKGAMGGTELSSFFQSEGRKTLGASNAIIGPFSNTLPLDLSFEPDQSFSEFARLLGQRLKTILALETGPVMETLLAESKSPTVSINMFPPAARISLKEGDVGPREYLDRRTEYDLNLVWSEEKGVLNGKAFYNPAQISTDRVQTLLLQQELLIDAALNAPHSTCQQVLNAARRGRTSLAALKGRDDPPERRLHVAPFAHAETSPDAIAIRTTDAQISYRQLVTNACAYAAALQAAGISEGDSVAIIADRSPALIEALLGVAAVGGVFVVIDGKYPPDRVLSLLSAAQSRFAIRAGDKLPDYSNAQLTWITPLRGSTFTADNSQTPRDMAYGLLTSGTTGRPKLIFHPEQTLQRFVRWQAETLRIERPVTMMLAGLSHDPIMRDIFLPLMNGGTIVIPSDDEMTEPARLRRLLRTAEVNVLHLTPATGRLLALGQEEWSSPSIKSVFWGGARLPGRMVETWTSHAPKARQFNLYGATETPQAALLHEIELDRVPVNVPVGRPLPWTRVTVQDDWSQALGPGEIGEIVIDLTDPVQGVQSSPDLPDSSYGRRHHTGDLGYVDAQANVRFVSRRDSQLKINGFRVEPSEIEQTAQRLANVAHACAVMPDAEPAQLWLFVSVRGSGVTPGEINAHLSRGLPSYMVPTQIAVLDDLPLTANGKIDRPALLALTEQKPPRSSDDDQRPTTQDEVRLAEILSKYTGQAAPLRSQSFADLGADSLSMLETRFALEEEGYELPDDWEFLSIKSLVEHRAEQQKQGSFWSVATRLNRMESFIGLRCLAIVMIVVHHAEFMYVPHGASILLFTLTGYAIGRMQMPAILNDGKTGRIWAMIARLLIPLVLVSVVLFAQNSVRGNDPHLAMLLPFENLATFIDEVMLQREHDQRREVWMWFLHVYLQMFLIIGGALSVPRIYRWLRKDVWRAALSFYAISNLLMATSMMAVLILSDSFSVGAERLAHFPTTILPFLAIGIVFAVAKSRPQRMVAFLAALAQFGAYLLYGLHTEFLWVLALFICAFAPAFSLPRFGSVIIASLSTQALMIYLTHKTVLLGLVFVSGSLIPAPIHVVIALAVGIAAGRMVRPLLKRAGVNGLAERRITFGDDFALHETPNPKRG